MCLKLFHKLHISNLASLFPKRDLSVYTASDQEAGGWSECYQGKEVLVHQGARIALGGWKGCEVEVFVWEDAPFLLCGSSSRGGEGGTNVIVFRG